MKRLFATALAGGLLAAGAWLVPLHADESGNPQCPQGDQLNIQLPIGVVCGQGDPTTQTGYLYADGNDDNPDPLDGYIGVNSEEGVVGCADGDYDDENTPHNVILDPANPQPPSPEPGPCTPEPGS